MGFRKWAGTNDARDGVFICADARNICQYIEPNTIELTITSPPYWNQKNYFDSQNQIGYGQNYNDYLEAIRTVFSQVHDVTTSNGTFWIVADTIRRKGGLIDLPSAFSVIARDVGWVLQDILIWRKDKTTPWYGPGQFRDLFEYILFFSKSKKFRFYYERLREPTGLKQWWITYPERYNPQGKGPASIWDIPIPVQGSWSNTLIRHACPFPPTLVERIIALTSDIGNTVFDPFAGSGVTIGQAHCMKRKYFGLDISEQCVLSFNREVLPQLIERWNSSNDTIESHMKDQEEFAIKIKKLRLVKYAKMFFKNLPETIQAATRGLIITSDLCKFNGNDDVDNGNHIIMDARIHVVTCQDSLAAFEACATSALNGKYIRKFGIRGQVTATTCTDVLNDRTLRRYKVLYMYENGKAYQASREVKRADLKKVFEEDNVPTTFPPILCNHYVFEERAQ